MKHDGDEVLHMLQGCLPYVEKLTSWIMILVDGKQDGMLLMATTILGGEGCKVLKLKCGWVLDKVTCATGAGASD